MTLCAVHTELKFSQHSSEHLTLERALKENTRCAMVDVEEAVKVSPSLWEKAGEVLGGTKASKLGFDGAEQAANHIIKYVPSEGS